MLDPKTAEKLDHCSVARLYPPVALIPQIGHAVIPITLGVYLYGITYMCLIKSKKQNNIFCSK
jgi:hypothetical protein